MPAPSSTYQATYLEPTAAGGSGFTGPLGRHRYRVAGSLYQLQCKLREGNTPAAAQAYVAAAYLRPVSYAAADLANQAILTDFTAIDSL